MDDRFGRKKWAFWVFVLALAALTAVPSAVLLRTVEGYYRFLTGFSPGTLRPIRVNFTDHRDGREAPDADLSFVEFRCRAPKAKTVELIGDFNGWKAKTLQMSRSPAGDWELMLPLPAGRYHYLFLVDGAETLDSRGAAGLAAGGRKSSLRTVP